MTNLPDATKSLLNGLSVAFTLVIGSHLQQIPCKWPLVIVYVASSLLLTAGINAERTFTQQYCENV